MLRKRLLAGLLAAVLALPVIPALPEARAAEATADVQLEKSVGQNPIGGSDAQGNRIYGGDPSVLVDGDTVYLYTGHDVAKTEAYDITEWICYSTKDLKSWNYEGVIMGADKKSITWADTGKDAWAAQMEKHYDPKDKKDKYYFYYCTWDATSEGKQSIGVAVSESPTGPFEDIGQPLVKGTLTTPESSGWNDIDPTVWVEKGADGQEHRYLAWGNGKFYVCELNEDMISVKDINGDGKITAGAPGESADIIGDTGSKLGVRSFTEAPWLYRRKDAQGNPTGPYYLFYAFGWREQMAYATTDDLMSGEWTFGKVLMPPAATSNTNHMAVFDFNGKTYFIYHNGSLPGGSGFRRVACIAEVVFEEDGSVKEIPETAAGINGTKTAICTNSGKLLSHETFVNSSSDSRYPYTAVKVGAGLGTEEADAQWVLTEGKSDPANAALVSIQSENKPGLYLTVNSETDVTLAQDADGSADTAKKQTLHSVQGLADAKGVSFESAAYPGRYLTIVNGVLAVTDGSDAVAATFYMNADENDASLRSIAVTMDKNEFLQGTKVNAKNAVVTALYANGKSKEVTGYTSDADAVDTKTAGTKTLTVTYTEGSVTKTSTVPVVIVAAPARVKGLSATAKTVKKKKKVKVSVSWKTAACAGYEISYGAKKSQHNKLGTKKQSVKKASYTCSSKKLKKGKKYYFHIRSYVKVNGEKRYSAYTSVQAKVK